jgi:hypothetical protein
MPPRKKSQVGARFVKAPLEASRWSSSTQARNGTAPSRRRISVCSSFVPVKEHHNERAAILRNGPEIGHAVRRGSCPGCIEHASPSPQPSPTHPNIGLCTKKSMSQYICKLVLVCGFRCELACISWFRVAEDILYLRWILWV